jgi:hypothetical protein
MLVFGCIVAALSLVAGRLLLQLSRPAARLRDAAARWARRAALDDAVVLGSWVLLLSSAALMALWWYFWPLFAALFSKVSTAPLERHAVLSSAFEAYQNQYWLMFSALLNLSVIGWYAVYRVAAAGRQALNRGLLAGGAAVMVLALASLDLPYRLLVDNKFEAVLWNDAGCYMIGERPDAALLFCPDLPPPRNRVVPRNSGTLQRLGRLENVFTRSYRSGAPETAGAARP